MLQYDEPTEMPKRLNVSKARDRVQQLDAHRTDHRQSVQEEQVPAGSRILDGVLNEVHDGLAFELLKRPETEVACGGETISTWYEWI